MATIQRQLISYIAPSAPATRRPATGNEPFLRPEIGVTPRWFREALGIDFGRRWHTEPAYRRETVIAMREELTRRFPGTRIGGIDREGGPLDLLTGVFGACTVAGIYGIPLIYAEDNWPNCEHRYLNDEEVDALTPPDLGENAFFRDLMRQVDWIASSGARVEGFVPHLAYIDMGLDSDLRRAREVFPRARRAIMYTPMDVANKPLETIRSDLKRIARDYAPCDIVFADIEAGTPDERVRDLLAICEELSHT